MSPLSLVGDMTKAITYPFRMIFVVSICAFINYFTSPGYWWFQWVAFGMGIGLMVTWARAIRAVGVAAITAAAGYAVYRWVQRRKENKSTTASANA